MLDSELAVAASRRPFADFHAFNALLEANPKAPRRARKEIFEMLSQPLDEEERALPLNRAGEAIDKQRLRKLQDAVAGVAAALEIPEGLLCARRHLEALLDGRGWPDALQGWRRDLLEPALTPLLP